MFFYFPGGICMNPMSVLFTQSKSFVVPTQTTEMNVETLPYVLSFLKNLEAYGFTGSESLIKALVTLTPSEFIDWSFPVLQIIKEEVGLRENMTPFYPNFPKQVMDLEDAEWIFHALYHYWTEGDYRPSLTEEEALKVPLVTNQDLVVLDLAPEDSYLQLFVDKISHTGSLSLSDRDYLTWIIATSTTDLVQVLPEEIPNRETFAILMGMAHEKGNQLLWEALKSQIKNPTEVLRIHAVIQTGSPLLTDHFKFMSIKRSLRRELVQLLEGMELHLLRENFWAKETLWKTWGRLVHVSEYQRTCPTVCKAFHELRNGKKPLSYHGKLNQLFDEKNHQAVIELLKKRPTEMARALDRVLRLEATCYPTRRNDLTSYHFAQVADEVPSNVLIQVFTYFNQRNTMNGRFFTIKNGNRTFGMDEGLAPLPEAWCENVCRVCECALMNRYQTEEPLEAVYLDEGLKKFTLPLVQRESSKQLFPYAKGSRLNYDPKTNVLRAFLYWQHQEQRVDLDLSAHVLTEDLCDLREVYYGNLRSKKYGIYHSGDFVSAKEGAAEYIDIHLETIQQTDARYIAITVHSFTGTPYYELEDCFVGFMERDGETGEAFEPRTVKQKADLTQDSTTCLVFLIDLKEQEIIWVDSPLRNGCDFLNNVNSTKTSAYYLVKSVLERQQPNLHHLLDLHIQARGGVYVETETEAHVVFGGETGLQPNQFDVILKEFVK